MIVPRPELKSLTGYRRPSAQVRWLRRNGWKFSVNAIGEPIVALAEFYRRMVGGKGAQHNLEPNYEGING